MATLSSAGCYTDNATGPVSYKFAPGNVFPTAPDHGVQLVESSTQCCMLCLSFKNCTFWTYEYGGPAAKPTCYSKPGACCYLKTAAAWAGRATGPPAAVSGSMKPLPQVDLCCRNGTNCGGTNLWTKWIDTSLPNSTYTNPGNMPYPKSLDLVDWEFKSGANPGYGSAPGPTMYKAASASADTFYPTWAADDNLYTSFTDGNVCDYVTGKCVHAISESNSAPWRVTHGQATLVGDDPFALNITDVKTYSAYTASPYKSRFPSGMLAYKGTVWYGTYWVPRYRKKPWSTTPSIGPLVDYRHSTDGGKTWVEPRINATGPTDNLFGEDADQTTTSNQVKFATPHFVDFGQELEHSPDGYKGVYHQSWQR